VRGLLPGNRLGRRLLLAIALFSVAASLVGTTVQLAAGYRGEVHALEERLEQIRSSSARSVAQSLWSLDEEPLRLQLEGMTTLPGMSAQVLRGGGPVLEPHLTADRLRALSVDEEHVRLTRTLGIQSLLAVSLVARGHTLGAITFVSATPERFGPAELALARELSRRAAIAIDNAWLFRHAEQAIRLREVFLSVAAHELRTPLLPLQLRLQSLLRRGRSGASVDPARLLGEVATAER
jgi:GAF domain-containing protein